MTYDSPATIRRRQVAAENKPAKGKRRHYAVPVAVLTDEQWAAACDFHIEAIKNPISADNAGARARALVHMAIERRAAEIRRDHGRAYWKAILVARHELFNTEVA